MVASAAFTGARIAGPAIASLLFKYLTQDTEKTDLEVAKLHAQRDVLIAQINAEQQVLQSYIDQRFAERRGSLDDLFGLLHQAVDNNNNDQIHVMLAGILNIMQQNPLEELNVFIERWEQGHIIEI